MKVKDLIHALSMANPESEVIAFDFTDDDARGGIEITMTAAGQLLIVGGYQFSEGWDLRPPPPHYTRSQLIDWPRRNVDISWFNGIDTDRPRIGGPRRF